MIGLSLRDVAFLGSLGLIISEYFYLGGDFRYVYDDEFGVNTAVPITEVTYNLGANNTVLTTAIQSSDGKIIIGGDFTSYNGTTSNRVARLHTNGSLDTSFDSTTGANSTVRTASIQSDGKIIIGGEFTSYNGTTSNYIARLHTNGSLDTGFAVGTGADDSVSTTSIQSDGKIIIGGFFTKYNGTDSPFIARLHTNGSLDTGFAVGTGANNTVLTTAIQSDGKIIIGGVFSSYNGTARERIARLHTNGVLDTSFVVGSGVNGSVSATSIQSDGKIIIGGSFTSYNGTTSNRIARLHTNGSIDTSFDIGTGADNFLYTASIQSDGKIIIGGSFTSYNGTTANRIARLHTNGSIDTSFDTATGSDNILRTTAIQSDGKIIIGGEFISFNKYSQNYVSILEEKLVSQADGLVKIRTDGSVYSSFNSTGYGYASGKIKSISEQPNGDLVIAGENMVIDDENKVKSLVMLSKTGNIKTPYINTYGSINKILSVDDGT